MKKYSGKEIAIVGISGRFNSLESPESLWRVLVEKEQVMQVQNPNEDGFISHNGTVEGKSKFDPTFFGYTSTEASQMDPQIRMLHEEIWKALEDAGEPPLKSKKKIGLFASVSDNLNWRFLQQYKALQQGEPELVSSTIADGNFAGTLIAYKLNLKGPVINVNTACSSSLVNVHLATRSLLMRECNVAIAAGMCATSFVTKGYIYQEGGVLSKDGVCRAFDKDASGTVSGEGGGVVVLKRLNDAIKDKDRIYALIKGSAIVNDGHDKVGYLAPSVNGQVECIQSALKFSQVEPDTVSYIETHGTGTSLGDSVEFEALRKTYGTTNSACVLGALKTSIGHLDTAAGIAGLIKTTLALDKKIIPPTLHFNEMNPELEVLETAFEVTKEKRLWKDNVAPRRAGVSSFGIGGTNAHVILEEFTPDQRETFDRDEEIFLCSAKSETALRTYENEIHACVDKIDKQGYLDLAYTLATGKEKFGKRSFSVRSWSQGKKLFSGSFNHTLLNSSNVIFMFPGQGLQYANMAQGLYESSDFFKNEINKGLELLEKGSVINYRGALFPLDDNQLINQTEFTQPLLFVLEYALAKWLMDLGITPDYMVGHSLGEYVAATLSGVFSFEEALQLIKARAELMCAMKPGSMMAVNCTFEHFNTLEGPEVDIAAINADDLIVISGEDANIDTWKAALRDAGVVAVKMETSHAFHSSMMDEAVRSFKQVLETVCFNESTIPIISSVTGEHVSQAELMSIDYWLKHMRNPVQFSKGIGTMLDSDQVVFIEIGPGSFLNSMVKKKSKKIGRKVEVIHLIKDKKDKNSERSVLLNAIGSIWKLGCDINFEKLFEKTNAQKCSAPLYTFDHYEFLAEFNIDELLSGTSDMVLSLDQTPYLDTLQTKISRTSIDSNYIAPSTATEIRIAEFWSELFEMDKIGKTDNFFDLGGDSIKALRFSNNVRVQLGVELDTQIIYENPTVEVLAKAVDLLEELSTQKYVNIQGENELTI